MWERRNSVPPGGRLPSSMNGTAISSPDSLNPGAVAPPISMRRPIRSCSACLTKRSVLSSRGSLVLSVCRAIWQLHGYSRPQKFSNLTDVGAEGPRECGAFLIRSLRQRSRTRATKKQNVSVSVLELESTQTVIVVLEWLGKLDIARREFCRQRV